MESTDPKVSLTAPSAEATRVRDHLASGGARTVRELASELGVPVGSISGMLDAGVVKVAQAPSARRCEKCNTPSETALCPSCRARLAAGGTLTRPASTGSEARVPTRHMATSLTGPPQEIVDAGSLHVEGSIGPGWRVRAGFDLTVGGQVERAEIEAGAGALRLDAPCRQSEIRAGHLRDLYGRLIAALADADRDFTALAGSAEALQQTATLRGQRLPLAVAVGALVKDRWADLADRLDAGSSLVAHERLRRPAVPETLLKALDGARDALADPSDIGLLRSRARALAGELATVRAGQGAPSRSIVDSLTECSADFAGALAVRGSGVHACELTVGGDLVLGGRNGSLGGHVCVHGKVVAPRIRGGTRLELPGGEGGLRLRADTVGAGVEITVCGQRIPFAKETRGLVIRVEPNGPVVETL